MKNGRSCLILSALFLATSLSVTAQERPTDEAAILEGDLGFAYSLRDGRPSLEANHVAVFCAEPALLVVDPTDQERARVSLNAEDLGDGTWAVPDEETGETTIAKVQYAASTYSRSANPTEASAATGLPSVAVQDLSIIPIRWNWCQRIRRGYNCGAWATCPGGCNNGYRYAQLRNFLVCQWTGNFWDLCLERLRPVCRLDRYKCLDCTGPIIASWLNNRWVCATF